MIKKVIGFYKPGAFMNVALEGLRDVVEIEERKMIEICTKYGAEDLGADFGEKWWDSRLTFFYPDKCLDFPKLYGTIDTVMLYSNVEKVYWAMKEAVGKI